MAERAVASGAPAGGAKRAGRSLETGNLKRFRTLFGLDSPHSKEPQGRSEAIAGALGDPQQVDQA